MDKTISITKEQHTQLANLIHSDRMRFSQFSVGEKLNRGEAYTTKDGRRLFKTFNTYRLDVFNFDEAKFANTIANNPNHRFAKVHAIVPLFEAQRDDASEIVKFLRTMKWTR
jgi:hypothetical protein